MLSKSIPQGPRNPNGYTAEEVERALTAVDGSRKLTFRYELLDREMNYKRDLDNVLSGSVQVAYISDIKRTASFQIQDRGDIDFLHDHIKPYCRMWMPPRWTEEQEVPDWKWRNDFGTTIEAPVTDTSVLGALGSAPDSISGTLRLMLSPRVATTSSLRFGGDDGSSGLLSTKNVGTSETRRRFRTYLYCESPTLVSLSWMDESGAEYGGGGAVDAGMLILGSAGMISIGGTIYSGALYDSIKDKWIRLEVDFDYDTMEYQYRFYSSTPYATTPDFTHDGTLTTTKKASGFNLLKGDDFGNPSKYLYVGPTALGDMITIPSRPNPTDKDFVEVPLGVFMMASPSKSINENTVVTRDISANDRTQLLIDDKLTDRFVITKGENYTTVLNTLLADFPRVIEPSTWVCGRTREFSVGTSLKEVVDRIAESIDYHTVQFDEEGTLILRPYVSPADRTAEYHYTDDEYSIMFPEAEVEFDISEIANVWIVSLNEADEDPVYVKIENHDPANPFSIPSRGRKIVDFREQEEGFDRASLLRKAKRIQFEANRVYENIAFTTAINPFHSVNDCYSMEYTPVGINNKYTEINWEIKLEAGSEMTHTCRRIVELDPELFEGFVDGPLVVNGAATMSNMKWGLSPLVDNQANKPSSLNITGLNLQGTGKTQVFLTADSAAPQNVKACGVSNRTANGFTIWSYRVNNTDNGYFWVAMREV